MWIQPSLPLGTETRRQRRRPGRKPNGPRAGVPHLRRPVHNHRHPLHVTVCVREGLPTLRSQSMFACVLAQIRFASRRFLRIVHFSVQSNHIHMLVEANDRGRLAQGMKGFAVRVARNLNGLLGIRGNVWADRYHAHALKTPREVRRALIYVLRNRVKHGGIVALDRHSSAFYFDGWHDEVGCPPPEGSPDEWPIAHSETWLINVGWRRSQGPLRLDEVPSSGRRCAPGT
jgi:REP element-mobilizing transposase RayT